MLTGIVWIQGTSSQLSEIAMSCQMLTGSLTLVRTLSKPDFKVLVMVALVFSQTGGLVLQQLCVVDSGVVRHIMLASCRLHQFRFSLQQ